MTKERRSFWYRYQDCGDDIGSSKRRSELPKHEEWEKIPGPGGKLEDINIHSIRLPGYVAHQEVIFGLPGQSLIIRHDSTNRESFMPGVILAIRKIHEVKRCDLWIRTYSFPGLMLF